MKPLDVLDFVVRHTAYKSTKAIASIAGTDPANLHSCLSGKRALPHHIARRVAAAVGLSVTYLDESMCIKPTNDTIITLKIPTTDLQQFADLLRTLSNNFSYLWKVFPGEGEIFSILIASINDSYVIGLLKSESVDDAIFTISKGFDSIFDGVNFIDSENNIKYSEFDSFLIRIKSGIVGKKTLDIFFGREKSATISEWAELLISFEREGITPGAVNAALQSDEKKRQS